MIRVRSKIHPILNQSHLNAALGKGVRRSKEKQGQNRSDPVFRRSVWIPNYICRQSSQQRRDHLDPASHPSALGDTLDSVEATNEYLPLYGSLHVHHQVTAQHARSVKKPLNMNGRLCYRFHVSTSNALACVCIISSAQAWEYYCILPIFCSVVFWSTVRDKNFVSHDTSFSWW